MNADITFRNGYYLTKEIFANNDTDSFIYAAQYLIDEGKTQLIEAHGCYDFKHIIKYVLKYGYEVVNAFVGDLVEDMKNKKILEDNNESDNG